MRLLLVFQVLVLSLYMERPYVRLSHPTDDVTAFHMSFLSLVCSHNVSEYDCLPY